MDESSLACETALDAGRQLHSLHFPVFPRKKIVLGLEVGFALGAKWAIFIPPPPSLQG